MRPLILVRQAPRGFIKELTCTHASSIIGALQAFPVVRTARRILEQDSSNKFTCEKVPIMPVFQLTPDSLFPPVHWASKIGLLAVGGDLSVRRLLGAYRQGIFPWYSEAEPILWWAPDPRFVLFPEEIRVARSMRQLIKKDLLKITYDLKFADVIAACQKPRPQQEATWITPDMQAAYIRLHERGYAHSVEVWQGEALVGGLYGVSLGRCFFGESMFSSVSNASKAALIDLTHRLTALDFSLIDCQVYTAHLESLGGRHIPRGEFMLLLKKALRHRTLRGNWSDHPAFQRTVSGPALHRF
jgi:leucyl/phenylalanyl-tRNA--protein transferase